MKWNQASIARVSVQMQVDADTCKQSKQRGGVIMYTLPV